MKSDELQAQYRTLLEDLNRTFAAGDGVGFLKALDEALQQRDSAVLSDVCRVSQVLMVALTHFRTDSRIVALAARDIPDARVRLDHVLQMTEDAAHRTLDIIERTVPLADITARGAKELTDTLNDRTPADVQRFLAEVSDNAAKVRTNLTEVMLAQGFQDLSGQILHGVRKLIGEVETVLDELARITGQSGNSVPEKARVEVEGPAVPGVTRNAVSGQSDVDDLMAGLGI